MHMDKKDKLRKGLRKMKTVKSRKLSKSYETSEGEMSAVSRGMLDKDVQAQEEEYRELYPDKAEKNDPGYPIHIYGRRKKKKDT